MSFADKFAESDSIHPFIRGVRNNSPEFMPIVPQSSIEAKKVLRELGIEKPHDMFAVDVPVALIDADALKQLDNIYRKLFCALFYKHVGSIFPSNGRIVRVATTNQIFDRESPFDWLFHEELSNVPVVQRSGKSLHDQFFYRWSYDAASELFAFNFHLRFSLFGIMVGPAKDDYEEDNLI